jgi:hypothetical protein
MIHDISGQPSDQGSSAAPDEELLANPCPWSRKRRVWLVGSAALVVAGVVLAVVNGGPDKHAALDKAATSSTSVREPLINTPFSAWAAAGGGA